MWLIFQGRQQRTNNIFKALRENTDGAQDL